MDKGKLVWSWVESDTGRYSLHCYYGRKRKDSVGAYTGETHNGNSALCNKRLGISEDGDSFLTIDQIVPDKLNEKTCCRSCLKIFKKLSPSPPNTTIK